VLYKLPNLSLTLFNGSLLGGIRSKPKSTLQPTSEINGSVSGMEYVERMWRLLGITCSNIMALTIEQAKRLAKAGRKLQGKVVQVFHA
jgi:hypothetical protein